MKRYAKRIIFLLLFFIIVSFCGGAFLLVNLPKTSPNADTDIEQYAEILKAYAGNDAFHHFPTTLPTNISEAYFYHSSKFLQGGTILQLRLKMPTNEIAAEKEKFISQEIYTFQGSTYDTPIPAPLLAAGAKERMLFPSTFEIIVLGAESAGNAPNQWNHGTTFGVAIDEINSEIVYWYEDW